MPCAHRCRDDQLVDLAAVFEAAGQPSHTNRFVFNGDFIDRGEYGVEVLTALLAYYLALPAAVYLGRGNHEDRLLCTAYGFRDELTAKYGETEAAELFEDVVAVFQALPLAATLRDREQGRGGLAIVHAGPPGPDNVRQSLAELKSLDRRATDGGLDSLCGNEAVPGTDRAVIVDMV